VWPLDIIFDKLFGIFIVGEEAIIIYSYYFSTKIIITMAEERNDEIFVYTGGEQQVPLDVRCVRIDKSVNIIPRDAFNGRVRLVHVEFHDGIERIDEYSFYYCPCLCSIKLLGVKVIEAGAFLNCCGLTEAEFGDKLETIGPRAFEGCVSLRSITMPSVRSIGECAFSNCKQLIDLDLPEGLDTVGRYAFSDCSSLRRIAIPLKDGMMEYGVFYCCRKLTLITLVGGIHKTIASLHLESWKNEMSEEINRINEVLSNTPARENTFEIQRWIESVIDRIEHYKTEHKVLLKEATTLLELALWKANLDDNEGGILEQDGVRTTRGKRKRARKEICITSGASIVIKNVLPFLTLLE
jgi:hypothetical protein